MQVRGRTLRQLMTETKTCDMIGCMQEVSGSYQIGPGTRLNLCKEHYDEIYKEFEANSDEGEAEP